MISHKHKFIFISPPKTGSTSLLSALLPYADFKSVVEQLQWNTFDFYEHSLDFKQKAWNYFTHNQRTDKLLKRSSDPRKHANLGSYTARHIERYQIFCVIRNPFDRIFSMWKWENSVKGFFEGIDYQKLEFREYLLKNMRDWYFKPQYDFIHTDHIDINRVNLIRFENLQNDTNTICDKIGIERQQLPHKNKTNHKHYTEYYGDETREIVAEKYAKDIEYFGYKFGE